MFSILNDSIAGHKKGQVYLKTPNQQSTARFVLDEVIFMSCRHVQTTLLDRFEVRGHVVTHAYVNTGRQKTHHRWLADNIRQQQVMFERQIPALLTSKIRFQRRDMNYNRQVSLYSNSPIRMIDDCSFAAVKNTSVRPNVAVRIPKTLTGITGSPSISTISHFNPYVPFRTVGAS